MDISVEGLMCYSIAGDADIIETSLIVDANGHNQSDNMNCMDIDGVPANITVDQKTMCWNTVELSPISGSERQALRNRKYKKHRSKNNRLSNEHHQTAKTASQHDLGSDKPSKLDMIDNSQLTSFPLAPPPSGSISNMDQILNDSSNINISFDSTAAASAQNNTLSDKVNEKSHTFSRLISTLNNSLLSTNVDTEPIGRNKRKNGDECRLINQQDPKIVVSRNDPIVLIEDYIPANRAPQERISVVNLRKSIFSLKGARTLNEKSSHERVLKKRSKGNLTQDYLNSDARKVTYNSIKSVKSFSQYSSSEEAFKSKHKLKSAISNKRSLAYLSNAITLLSRDVNNHEMLKDDKFNLSQFKSSDFNFTTNIAGTNTNDRTVSNNTVATDTFSRSASSSTNISIEEPDGQNGFKPHYSHKSQQSVDTIKLPCSKGLNTDSNAQSFPSINHISSMDTADSYMSDDSKRLSFSKEPSHIPMMATSSRNNSFIDLSSMEPVKYINQPKKRNSSILASVKEQNKDILGTLKYCMICDKPLYDLSSLIQEGCKFKIFVCDGCTNVYNDIVMLLKNLEFEISNNVSDSSQCLTHEPSFMSIDTCLGNMSDAEDEQLISLAELIALELNEDSHKENFDGSSTNIIMKNEQHFRNVKMYEKILKLLLLLNNGDAENDQNMTEPAEDTTTDLGDGTVRTFALDPSAGFENNVLPRGNDGSARALKSGTIELDTKNILKDITNFSDESSVRSQEYCHVEPIPLPKQRQKTDSLDNGNKKSNFQQYYRSVITKPSTTRLVSTDNDNTNKTKYNSDLSFSNNLLSNLHKQLDNIDNTIPSINTTLTNKNSLFSFFRGNYLPLLQTNANSTTSTTQLNSIPTNNTESALNKKQSLLNLNLEQEWAAFKKKCRWRWRIKGLMPGIDLARSE